MKILIVDDDTIRARQISKAVSTELKIDEGEIDLAECCNTTKRILRNIYYDLVILDVALPKNPGDMPTLQNGLTLLDEIVRRPAFKKPERILGITAHIQDLGALRNEFENKCFSIIEASSSDSNWIRSLVDSIRYTMSSKISRIGSDKDIIVITAHGIRSFGDWQESFKSLISKHVSNISFQSYKYGYFDIISFFIPLLRNKQVAKFRNTICKIALDNPDKSLYIFSHSFGTYLAVKAIEGIIKEQEHVSLELLVLSGSVLKSNHDWSLIVDNTSALIVNECANSDYVLWASESFVPGTGMAGKVGFYGINNERFSNRYHNGGHNIYFTEPTFIETYWLPLFYKERQVVRGTSRESNIIVNDGIESIINMMGAIKTPMYIFISIYLLFYLFNAV